MADLPEALDAALRARYGWKGVRTPATQRRGLMARINQLEKHYKQKGDRPAQTAARAARAAGIHPDTWTRWKNNKRQPSADSLAKLEKAHQDAISLPALRRALTANGLPAGVKVSAVVRWMGYYNRGGTPPGQRTVRFGPSGMDPALRSTIRAWAHDGPEAAALAFEYGMSKANNVPDESGYPEPGDTGPGVRFEDNHVTIEWL